jgi:hypothetical protein
MHDEEVHISFFSPDVMVNKSKGSRPVRHVLYTRDDKRMHNFSRNIWKEDLFTYVTTLFKAQNINEI